MAHYASLNAGYPQAPSHYLTNNLGEQVCVFHPTGSAKPVVTKVEPVASYSWIDAPMPTIAVPSSPNVWKSTAVTRVSPDSGRTFIDQNAFRMKGYGSPLAPMFAAIEDMYDGNFDYDGIDFVSDRNNLRKLLRWATGKGDKDFRIDVQLAGARTCLFVRCEKRDAEFITGFVGFGHEYEKASTHVVAGSEGETGHHRIIKLSFGNKKILLRCEIDACTGVSEASSNHDDLLAAFQGLSISKSTMASITVKRTPSRIIVPQSSLIELKTRAAHRPLDWEETYPQLYLSQTPFLYLAKHTKGTFAPAEKHELAGPAMKAYAKQAQAGMGKLSMVLDEIQRAVKNADKELLLSLVCRDGKLVLYKRRDRMDGAVEDRILHLFA